MDPLQIKVYSESLVEPNGLGLAARLKVGIPQK